MSNWKVRTKFFDSGKVIVYPVKETNKPLGHAYKNSELFDEWTDVYATKSSAEKYIEVCISEGAKRCHE